MDAGSEARHTLMDETPDSVAPSVDAAADESASAVASVVPAPEVWAESPQATIDIVIAPASKIAISFFIIFSFHNGRYISRPGNHRLNKSSSSDRQGLINC
jgi:hypothetical protein